MATQFGRDHEKALPAFGKWRPETRITVLRRCTSCFEPHPMARTPPIKSDICPDCGKRCEREREVVVPSAGNFWLWVGNKCYAIGEAIARLAKRI